LSATLTIRPATVNDAAQISALIASVSSLFFEYPSGIGAEHFVTSSNPENLALYFARPEVIYWYAEYGAQFCGVVALRKLPARWHLQHYFLVQEFRGQGIGRALWELAKARALATSPASEFSVNASITAVPIYQRFGFTSVGPISRQHGLVFQPMQLLNLTPPAHD
jgi:GNAT superfamily N-acetyltransferase